MEGIITLIVIIIIFNLLNRLVNAAKRQQQPPAPRRRTYGPGRPLPDISTGKTIETQEPHDLRSERRRDYYAGFEDQEEDVEEADEAKKPEDNKDLDAKRSVREKTPAVPASNSLRKILSDKDSLVAAFIFHEALSGPPVSRRKKKTALNRFR